MAAPTDEDLVRRLATGGDRALALLLRRHETALRAWFARRLPRYEDAEEAVQDVFLKLRRGAVTFREECAFFPWFRAIAKNVLRDRLRRRREPPVLPLEREPADLLDVWRRDRRRDEVRRALASLPRPYRAALTLKYLAGMSYREAARVLGLTERGFETRLARAKKRLRETLTGPGGTIDDL